MLHRGVKGRVMMCSGCKFDLCDIVHGSNEMLMFMSRLDGITPSTPLQSRSANGPTKRKSTFETPAVPKFNKADGMSSPSDARQNGNTNGVQ